MVSWACLSSTVDDIEDGMDLWASPIAACITWSNRRRNTPVFAASDTLIYSASAVDRTTEAGFLDHHEMEPPRMLKTKP